jgi:hypothetical protein
MFVLLFDQKDKRGDVHARNTGPCGDSYTSENESAKKFDLLEAERFFTLSNDRC